MAGGHLDEPEQMEVGVEPYSITDRYYYARGPQQVNRIVDITAYIEKKLEAICANKTQVGNMVKSIRAALAKRDLKLPILETDDEAAIRQYAEVFLLEESRQTGRGYGIEYAEKYHYFVSPSAGPYKAAQKYIEANAVPMD